MTNLGTPAVEAVNMSPLPELSTNKAAKAVLPEIDATESVPPDTELGLTLKDPVPEVVLILTLPVPAGATEKSSLLPVVMSVVIPEKVTVDVKDLFERFSVPPRVANVPVVGSVTSVEPDSVRIKS